MPDTDGPHPDTADATATPRGRPRGTDPDPSPITDSSEPAPRDQMATGPRISQISGRPKNPSKTQCTYRCVVLPDPGAHRCAPSQRESQCTYRCVVLPDAQMCALKWYIKVSMHLQVRGAP